MTPNLPESINLLNGRAHGGGCFAKVVAIAESDKGEASGHFVTWIYLKILRGKLESPSPTANALHGNRKVPQALIRMSQDSLGRLLGATIEASAKIWREVGGQVLRNLESFFLVADIDLDEGTFEKPLRY